MATYYRTGVETYSIIGTAEEKSSLEGRIPDGSTYFAVDENMFYTFYGGQWYETLPEAARLYHDDVGTDTKPIKLVGGVATAVANELAEDSKVVHKTGDETVGGRKVFTDRVEQKHAAPTYWMTSTADYQDNSWKGYIRTNDQKNGAATIHSDIIAQTEATNNMLRFSVYTPDRSAHYDMIVRAFADHQMIQVAPYYPVDGQSNPLALDNNFLEASGNIAVDPRLVHVFGNEEIAGTKTFSSPIYGRFAEKTVSNDTTESHLWFKCFRVKAENGVNVRFGIRSSYNWPDSANAFFSIGCAGNTEADIRCNCIYSAGISAEYASLSNYKAKVEAFDGVNYLVFYVRRLNRYTSIRIYDYWATKWGADIPIIWYSNEWTSEPTSAIATSGYYLGGVLT